MRTDSSGRSVALGTLLALACFISASPIFAQLPQQSGSGTRILVDATDSATLRRLASVRASLLVDYGAFSLWRVNAQERSRLAGAAVAASNGELDTIYLRDGSLDTAAPSQPAVAPNLRQRATGGSQLWLLQFIGPIQDQWLTDIAADGLMPVAYMPNNAYVVWGENAALQRAAQRSSVAWTGPYHPAYRIAPSLNSAITTQAGMVDVTVQFYTTATTGQSLAQLQVLGGQVYRQPQDLAGLTDISLALPAAAIETVANWADVFNVEPWTPAELQDEAQGQIIAGNLSGGGPSGPGYLAWLQTHGFSTNANNYPIVDIVDDGVDIGNAANPAHSDFRTQGQSNAASRIAYVNNCTASPSANGVDGHGNINAGIVGGFNNRTGAPYEDAQGYNYGLGISPYGRIANTKIFNNSGNYDASNCGFTDQGVVQASVADGASITSNSWGANNLGAPYNAASRAYDILTRDGNSQAAGNQQILHIFSAGNAGSQLRTISTPATAKNVISVGASENVRDNGIADGCTEINANNSNDMAAFSSRGPTSDGRAKPDLVAPGTHIQGPASQDPAYTGTGVCGDADGSKYYPANQTLYTWSTGTSHAAPAVSGAASLIHEYYRRVLLPGQTPSPAMVKALLLNTTRYLTGVSANDTLPSAAQGWGGLNLGPLVDQTTSRFLIDQTTMLAATGNTYQRVLNVPDATKPFVVTLAWTDAPGSTTSNAYVNNLNLEVAAGGTVYRGNVFNGATSTSGGSADPRNNVEQVRLPAGITGAVSVRVVAANIAGDGVPGNGDATDQDFALVVSNAQPTDTPQPILTIGNIGIDDSAGNSNGIPDPGETIAVSVPISNEGDGAATGVTGTLTVGVGATVLTSTLNYPTINSGETATPTEPFLVKIDDQVSCGASLEVSFSTSATNITTMNASTTVLLGTAPDGTAISYGYLGATAAIPDNNASGVTLPIAVPATGRIHDVNVRFSATHPHTADLRVWLVAPDGTRLRLIINNGGSNGVNFNNTVLDDEGSNGFISTGSAPFSGSFIPIDSLSKLDGKQIAGIWNLNVVDTVKGSTGSVTDWGLDFEVDEGCLTTDQITVDTISPDHVPAGSSDVTAIISGSNFVAGSQIRWTKGVTVEMLTPSDVTSTTMTFVIPTRLLSSAGTAKVQVVAPLADGRSSSSLNFAIVKRDQTIDFPPLGNRVMNAQPFTISAIASSGLAVTFTAQGACSVADSRVTLNGAGTCTITASQPGNELYNAAPEVARTFNVGTTLRLLLPYIRK